MDSISWPSLEGMSSLLSWTPVPVWAFVTGITFIGALNTRGHTKLNYLAVFLGIQNIFFYNMKRVLWYDEMIARFFGFTVIKLSLHISYLILIEDRCVANPDGSWNWKDAWNLGSNPRGIKAPGPEAEKPRTEAEQIKEKPVTYHVENTGLDKDGAAEQQEDTLTWRDVSSYELPIYSRLPARVQFIIRRIAWMGFVLVPAFSFTQLFLRYAGPYVRWTDFGEDKTFFLHRIHRSPLRDWITRISYVFLAVTTPPVAISIGHNLCAVVMVAVGLSGPDEWPLLFGSPAHAKTLRGWWSKSWHRIFAVPAVRWARWGALKLGLRRESLAYGLFISGSVFAASGLMHGAIEMRFRACGTRMDFLVPVLNYAGIVVEGLFQWALGKIVGSEFWTKHSRLCAVVGYIWVIMFSMEFLPQLEILREQCILKDILAERAAEAAEASSAAT